MKLHVNDKVFTHKGVEYPVYNLRILAASIPIKRVVQWDGDKEELLCYQDNGCGEYVTNEAGTDFETETLKPKSASLQVAIDGEWDTVDSWGTE